MNNFFHISSVAIIGASLTKGKIGNVLLENLKDFQGQKFGVNPKGGEYGDIKIYTSVADIPIIPDIAVFAIPASQVKQSLIPVAQKGIKRGVILSAGFKEIGNTDGEEEIIEIAKQYGVDILGPNCLGYIDINRKLNLSFGAPCVNSGNIALISQSGAMAVALTDWAAATHIGFSKMISMGNKSDIDENYLLKQLQNHRKHTEVIALYLESIQKGKEFLEITKTLSKQLPIVLIKSGVSKKGSQAASSHTGALSSEKAILDTAFAQAGIHTTSSLEDFFLWSQAFSKTQKIDIPDELIIVTNAGGPGVMATDHAETFGASLASFSIEEEQILKSGIPVAASVHNPIDIIGDATSLTYSQILQNISKLQKKRALLILLTPQSVTDVENIAEVIIHFQKENPGQFIMVSFMGGVGVEKGRKMLQKAGLFEYDYPRKALLAYSRLLKQKDWEQSKDEKITSISLPKPGVLKSLQSRLSKEKKLCNNMLTSEVIEAFGIPTLKEKIASSQKDISQIWEEFGGVPLAASVVSPDVAHKSDVGGIALHIDSLQKAVQAYNDIHTRVRKNVPNASITGVIFSPMVETNDITREIFVGFKRDESFGNILFLGAGGIYVNIYNDIARRIGLVSKDEILKMLEELTIFPILQGARGKASIHFESLVDTIFRLQYLFDTCKQIKEIDINPIFVDDEKSIIIDAKFYLYNS